ncbi:ABC transporter substrate-binding protein [Chrysiogenes arsenatis]|uniref:ABC transporter substrate-binding protein n=1 Tax=Chrysiogenes arsenatis TaxID=309797 RepID=UPI0003F84F3D|nr:ABC transporter substrate-binding protein [Chrysiogenes arsenatis]
MILRRASTIVLSLLLMTILAGCDFYEMSRQKRDALAQANTGDIEIAVVWPQQLEAGLFMEGVQLAAEEINTTGVYAKRSITLRIFDETSAEQSKRVAQKIAANPKIVAAIGHYGSSRSLPAAVTYEYNGILYMSPVATSPSLTRFGFNYLFRNIPTDAEISAAVLTYCQKQNWKNAAIVYVRGNYGQSFTEIMQEEAYLHDINIATLKSYAENQEDFRAMIVEMRRYQYDFVFIADVVPRAAHFIRQYRAMGGTEPFIGGDGLDSNLLWTIAGKAANETVVATTFDAADNHPNVKGFVERFTARYPDKQPDFLAAQGYDALMVIANAMRHSQSSVPIEVASALRFSPPWEGVLGTYAMQLDGSIAGKKIAFKKLSDGVFYLQQDSEE